MALGGHGGGAVLAEANTVAGASAVEEKVVALGGDFEPCAENVAPAESATDGEAEILGGDLGGACIEKNGAGGLAEGRIASTGDGESSPAGANEAGGGERCGEVGEGDISGPGADAVGGAVWVSAGD